MKSLTRRKFVATGLGLGTAATFGSAGQPLRTFERSATAFGTVISLQIQAESDLQAKAALDEAISEIRHIEAVMSLYDPESQVWRLNVSGYLPNPDQKLVEVLQHAVWTSKLTQGAFDITVQPLWQALFGQNAPQPPLPDYAKISMSSSEISFQVPGMAITLNGIAQGYAADRVMTCLKRHGISSAMIDTGELARAGRREGSGQVAIQHPRVPGQAVGHLHLDDGFVATSGDYSAPRSDDFAQNHILDPRTGLSPTELSSVTVLAPSGIQADALSTAFMVMGAQAAHELCVRQKDVHAILVRKSGEVSATPGAPVRLLVNAR